MRIDAIGLPIDRLQLRSDPLRQPARPTYVPLTPTPANRVISRSEPIRPILLPTAISAQAAATAQAAAEATVARGTQSVATPGHLLDQLRRQRLSLGRMLGDVNRHLAEPVSHPAD